MDFRSDTVTRPTAAMRQAMAEAEVGDDVMREDPTVRRLEAEVARLLGKEAGLLVPSGTMANQIGVKVFTQPGDEIVCEATCHVLEYEGGGIGLISGVSARPLASRRGILDPDDVRRAIRDDDIHHPRTGLICIENTHNLHGGVPWTPAELGAVRAVAAEHGVPILMDGARLLNAAVAQDLAPAALAESCDLTWIALSKGLSCPVGSVMAGDRATIERCRRVRKVLGGGMRQAGVLAAAGLVALATGVERLREDHARARRLAEGVAGLPGTAIDPADVRTNIVMVRFPGGDAARAAAALAERGVLASALAADKLRFVTHREIGDEDVERAVAAMRAVLAP